MFTVCNFVDYLRIVQNIDSELLYTILNRFTFISGFKSAQYICLPSDRIYVTPLDILNGFFGHAYMVNDGPFTYGLEIKSKVVDYHRVYRIVNGFPDLDISFTVNDFVDYLSGLKFFDGKGLLEFLTSRSLCSRSFAEKSPCLCGFIGKDFKVSYDKNDTPCIDMLGFLNGFLCYVQGVDVDNDPAAFDRMERIDLIIRDYDSYDYSIVNSYDIGV
jgi:hypothetical protein